MRWEGQTRRIDPWRVEIPKTHKPGMRVPGLIYASEGMMEQIAGDQAPEQVANVATLPGIVGRSLAMPDIHWGYGFPIGGVAAFDPEEGGVVSPGGVGFDINCGVRLIRTNLDESDVRPHLENLVETLFRNVPSGVGEDARVKFSASQLDTILGHGVPHLVEEGWGWAHDMEHIEHGGHHPEADPRKVSDKARSRGRTQLGSLGAGNHFLEIQRIAEIYDEKKAKAMGLTHEGQICIMVHTGSRGCGHQICTDHLKEMERSADAHRISLVDRQLACAPWDSREAQDYYHAMCSGMNFAFANRQMITHWTRESFEKVVGGDADGMDMQIVYDVCHNIAKVEEHTVDGSRRKLVVHRKGATRAFAPGHRDIPQDYRDIGQPVLIPGDMGSCSYVMAGTEQAMKETFGSACHGAGRALSRAASKRQFRGEQVIRELRERGIIVKAASAAVAAEEAPGSYKDVSQVVETCHMAGIALKVAKLEPIGCVKG